MIGCGRPSGGFVRGSQTACLVASAVATATRAESAARGSAFGAKAEDASAALREGRLRPPPQTTAFPQRARVNRSSDREAVRHTEPRMGYDPIDCCGVMAPMLRNGAGRFKRPDAQDS